MSAVLIFFAGIGVGGVGVAALIYLGRAPYAPQLPTPLPLAMSRARVARHNRNPRRPYVQPASVGVVVRRAVPEPLTSFDKEPSHGE